MFFKTKRSQANKQVVRIRKSIFEIAQDRRVKKLEYLRALESNDDVEIHRIQYIDELGQIQYGVFTTPLKNIPYSVVKVNSTKDDRKEMINKLLIPLSERNSQS